MAGKWSLALVVIVLKFVYSRALDPPQDVAIVDPGHLGVLEIHWSPTEHIWMKDQGQCSVRYELDYFDSYRNSWITIRTTLTSYRAQFDLGQEVKVRVYTLISGDCAGGGTVKSQNCTELIKTPDRTGVDGIQNLTCVYYNLEYVVCRWKRSAMMPAQAHVTLYYWHYELAHVEECPRYVITDGFRSGCNFTGTKLPRFQTINLCVNASSARPVRTLYSSLQIQNFVKLNAVREVRVEAGADGQLSVLWDSPNERIPTYCVQWEVEERRESHDGKQTLQIFTTEVTALTLTLGNDESSCLRVRSMLNDVCTSGGLWSDWSPPVCYPEKKLLASASRQEMLPWYIMFIPVVFGAALILGLCVWAVVTLGRLRQVKTKDSALSRLFDKFSSKFSTVAQHV